jgi:hypothetical protein
MEYNYFPANDRRLGFLRPSSGRLALRRNGRLAEYEAERDIRDSSRNHHNKVPMKRAFALINLLPVVLWGNETCVAPPEALSKLKGYARGRVQSR